jgi:hypothetical protein
MIQAVRTDEAERQIAASGCGGDLQQLNPEADERRVERTRRTFLTYMLATSPQKRSGWSS